MERRHLQVHAPGLDLRQIEDVVDQREQVAPGLVDVLEIVGLLLVHLAEHALDQHLGETDDRVERRAQLVRHVGEELRLVLVGDLELGALLLDFLEEPHVLDRDRGLVGEGVGERDLLLAERPHFGAPQEHRAERLAFAHQRHREHAVVLAELLCTLPAHRVEVARVLDVLDMHRLALGDGAARDRAGLVCHGLSALQRGGTAECRAPHDAAFQHVDRGRGCIAKACRALRDRIEHRFHVARRARDNTQHFGDCGLLVERLR